MTPNSPEDQGRGEETPLVHIFADESCLGNQFESRRNPGGAAGLVERFEEPGGWYRRDFAHFDPDTTNNRMALRSGIVSLGALRRPCRVVFTSDAQYLIKGMTEWVHSWAGRGWRRKGGAIENLDLWQDLSRTAARHQIEWRWTRGHSADVKNEYADWLAVRTATERKGGNGLVASGFEAWLIEQQEKDKFVDFLDVPDHSFHPHRAPPTV